MPESLNISIVPLAGSKRLVAPALVKRLVKLGWTPDKRLVEPYAGTGAVAVNAIALHHARHVWLNDLDYSTYAMWNALLHTPDALYERVREIGQPDMESVKAMWESIDTDEQLDAAATRVVVGGALARGVYRASGKRAACLRSDYSAERRVRALQKVRMLTTRANSIRVTNMDALDVVRESDPAKDVLYIDPPYFAQGQSAYRINYKRCEHAMLADALRECETPWLLSYDDAPEIRALYSWARVEEVDVPYKLRGGGVRAQELVITSPPARKVRAR